MYKRAAFVLLMAASLAAFAGPMSVAQEFYYDLDATYEVVPSPSRIAVQFDTTRIAVNKSQFFAAHPCLNDTVEVTYLHRGFWIYGLQPSYGYEASAAELQSDAAVHRVAPIYMTPVDSAEFKVSDLIDVQFDIDLSRDLALALLAEHGLQFVDSNEYKHNLWRCALDDTIKASPLAYGNAMHVLPGVEWACARQYATAVLTGPNVNTDPFHQYQYHLMNTGQNGGTPGIDIAADQAWQIPLLNPSLLVAVLDDGIVSHEDLPASRLRPGWDFVDNDNNPSPTFRNAHGMAVAGLLAATTHNGIGVSGVFGSCRIIPVRIIDSTGISVDSFLIADAIRYAQREGARVISNSWGYRRISPIEMVANAIRDVTSPGCAARVGKDPEAGLGSVVVFGAGNSADDQIPLTGVNFPANMPEVISVGAIKNTGVRWDYSCYGNALDVMAPSGGLWTTDQMDLRGWTPYISQPGLDNWNYMKIMSGTSGACPQVAGIAALLLARGHDSISTCNPGPKIREIITRTATDMGTAGWDQYYGYGLANAYRAMLSIIHGDVNNDGVIDIQDIIMEIDIAFSAGHAVLDDAVGDVDIVNSPGVVDVMDVVYLVAYVFGGGPPPPICYE